MATEKQDAAYERVAAEFGPAVERLARAYERDAEWRRDLLQEVHFALWRSFEHFDGRCSLRTWVYRVAHNAAASHVARRLRAGKEKQVTIEELVDMPGGADPEHEAGERQDLMRLFALIARMQSPDRQVMVLYLEGLDAAEIGEIAGLTPAAVAARIHRIKLLLKHSFHASKRHDG
jgi:RNA polymerase sigma factor (sigma-70 family)